MTESIGATNTPRSILPEPLPDAPHGGSLQRHHLHHGHVFSAEALSGVPSPLNDPQLANWQLTKSRTSKSFLLQAAFVIPCFRDHERPAKSRHRPPPSPVDRAQSPGYAGESTGCVFQSSEPRHAHECSSWRAGRRAARASISSAVPPRFRLRRRYRSARSGLSFSTEEF